ncbi:MAG: DUF4136 domain-containing protein [Proteobacteria bacterium]|nr:DUF4136 domain-containing protein [Pseudomonadota bacterium]
MNRVQLYIAIVIVFTIVGTLACAPFIISGCISSATYQPHPGNATFFVVQSDKNTLTERNIQTLIEKEMEKLGFKRAVDRATADVAVLYSSSIGAGVTETVVSSSPDFVWGGQKVSSSSSTEYPRYFHIAIIDLAQTHDPKEPVFIWQAELYSSGSSSNISWLAETFVPELFKWYCNNVTNKRFMTTIGP